MNKLEQNCPICGAVLRNVDNEHYLAQYTCGTGKYIGGPMEGEISHKGFGCKSEKAIQCHKF